MLTKFNGMQLWNQTTLEKCFLRIRDLVWPEYWWKRILDAEKNIWRGPARHIGPARRHSSNPSCLALNSQLSVILLHLSSSASKSTAGWNVLISQLMKTLADIRLLIISIRFTFWDSLCGARRGGGHAYLLHEGSAAGGGDQQQQQQQQQQHLE